MKEFIELVLNGITPVQFVVFLLYAYIGLVANMVVDIVKRDKKSVKSPVKFSWKYWWGDNKNRFIVSAILIPIAVVMFTMITGKLLNIMNAFMIGWAGDAISEIIKRKKQYADKE
jgi:hypothetical protein